MLDVFAAELDRGGGHFRELGSLPLRGGLAAGPPREAAAARPSTLITVINK